LKSRAEALKPRFPNPTPLAFKNGTRGNWCCVRDA
jgi:hypothetical protein